MVLILRVLFTIALIGWSIYFFTESYFYGNFYITLGVASIVFAIVNIVMLMMNPPAFCCPDCGVFLWDDIPYCDKCGYELVPHCIDCGEICRTAFCRLCGAEQ